MANPVPAGSDLSAGTYRCSKCGNEIEVGSTNLCVGARRLRRKRLAATQVEGVLKWRPSVWGGGVLRA